jgi:hypothetical protein
MDPNRLAEHYSSMQTSELVSLHSTGTLVDDAYPILEAELARRSIIAGPRPAPPIVEVDPPFFSGHWSGLYPASSANGFVAGWVPALLAGTFLMIDRLARYLASENSFVSALRPTFAILMLVYLFFATVAVWRCAGNQTSGASVAMARFTGLRKIVIFAVAAIMVLTNER